jgi:protein required for attachment to host cells
MEKLMDKFDLFVRFNPQFGRKVIKIERIPKKKVIIEYNDKHMNFYKEYPKSAFPKLPVIVDIDNNNHYYDSPVSSYESMHSISLLQRLVNRINGRLVNRINEQPSLIREEIFSSSDDEDVDEESSVENAQPDENEENIVEEDTTDDSDSVS